MFFPWVPTLDGNEVPGQPLELFEEDKEASKVPLMIGNVYEGQDSKSRNP